MLIQQQKEHIAQQDEKIDEIIGVVRAVNYEAENFKTEATMQTKMIDKLNDDID